MSRKKKLRKIFDIRMRTLFKDNRIAADFINGVLFNGQQVISFDDVSILDSNQDSHVFSIGITKERTRDNIVSVRLEDCQCIIGIEHQAQVDKTMFQRTMDYDEMSYLQQFFQYQSQLLPINGVMTLVAYYGQKPWKHARTYKDMMGPIPPTLKPYMNVESYPLIEMRYMDEERFHTPELKELVRGLKYLYESQYDDAQEITISQEIAITLAALTKNKKIYKKVRKGEIDMCKAIKDYGKQKKKLGKEEGISIGRSEGITIGRNEGISIGRKEGIGMGIVKTLIRQLQLKFGNLSSNTLDTIQSCNQEQLDYLTIHIFDIQEEKDITRYLNFV